MLAVSVMEVSPSVDRGLWAVCRLASRLQVAGLEDLQVQVLRGGFEKWEEVITPWTTTERVQAAIGIC
jgi:3-mercaptopyruvate sulfurtransferase SseA